ncbi:DNA-binding response regulator [Pseudonocardiaceae bacterium YIM PH 21723]|nr:DNA-binding response regulator [Pseudonocardiaceae bacterium YIM PH 21723]
MGSLNNEFPLQSRSISRSYRTRTNPMGNLAPDESVKRSHLGAELYPLRSKIGPVDEIFDANVQVVLFINDNIHRYSIEGMCHALDIRLTVQAITGFEELSAIRNGQLIISSSNAVGPVPGEIADLLRAYNMRLLVLVDSSDVVEQFWVDHANGFLAWEDLHPETLREAIVDVDAGRFHMSASLARRSLTAPDQGSDDTASKRASLIALTARENQILRMIAEGLSNRQIARSLGISEHGVKRAVGIILAKLSCPNRTLAAVRAIESGLLVM